MPKWEGAALPENFDIFKRLKITVETKVNQISFQGLHMKLGNGDSLATVF